MYNAPVVGNGLGGLPRRATTVSVAAVPQRKYPLALQAVGSPISKSNVGIRNFYGVVVPAGKNLCIQLASDVYPATNPFTFGMSYDPILGMTGFASNSSTVSEPSAYMMPQSFSDGIIYNTSTIGEIYIGRTNGTTTAATQLVSIPSSGTFNDGSSYSSLTELYQMPSNSYKIPVCFDPSGNLVLLYLTTVSSVNYISAFIINSGGTVISKQKLFAVDGANRFSSTDTIYMVVKSGSGLIVAASRITSGNSRLALWNVSANLSTVSEYYSASYSSMPDGSNPNYNIFYISSTAAMLMALSSTYAAVWGGAIDSNGAVSVTNNVDAQFPTRASFPFLNGINYFDANNYTYRGVTLKIQIGATGQGSYNTASIYDVASVTGDGAIASPGINLVASAATGSSPSGINGPVKLGYMGNGLWAATYSDNSATLYAQLYKEV
jgi:hypothetical protein